MSDVDFQPQGGEAVCVAGTTASSWRGHVAASLAQTPPDMTSCHLF